MNTNRILFSALLMVSLIIAGCEYDVTQPQWDKPYTEPSTPVITGTNPEQVILPGINTITIQGHDFAAQPEINEVWFNTTAGEVISTSDTRIVVRRPTVLDSCQVKVVSHEALVTVTYNKKFFVEPVVESYGSFLDNVSLSTISVDDQENVYVVETASRNIYRVASSGEKAMLAQALRTPTDASVGIDGQLYLLKNNRAIDVLDNATLTVDRWTQLPRGYVVSYGDFDSEGYMYVGGDRTDIVAIAPDLSVQLDPGFYPDDEILAIHVSGSDLYVASRPTQSTDPAKIYKHALTGSGSVGGKTLVCDLSTASEDIASRELKGIEVAEDGKIYLATYALDPILVVDPATGQIDYFYKSILPPYCWNIAWGNGSLMYMIIGNSTDGSQETWTTYQVDMGSSAVH